MEEIVISNDVIVVVESENKDKSELVESLSMEEVVDKYAGIEAEVVYEDKSNTIVTNTFLISPILLTISTDWRAIMMFIKEREESEMN